MSISKSLIIHMSFISEISKYRSEESKLNVLKWVVGKTSTG